MTYLGIDQSLRNTGVCVLNEFGELHRVFTVHPRGLHGVKRLAAIQAALRPHLEGVACAALEGYAYGKTMGAHQLGEVGAAVQLLLEMEKVRFIAVAPTAVKKFATGQSTATKEMMISAVPFRVDDDHQADAYALARIAYLYATGAPTTKRAQLEVVQHLKNPSVKKQKRRARRLNASV